MLRVCVTPVAEVSARPYLIYITDSRGTFYRLFESLLFAYALKPFPTLIVAVKAKVYQTVIRIKPEAVFRLSLIHI